MTRFLQGLNRLYRYLGTWKAVAEHMGINDRTLRRYWDGTRKPKRIRMLDFA